MHPSKLHNKTHCHATLQYWNWLDIVVSPWHGDPFVTMTPYMHLGAIEILSLTCRSPPSRPYSMCMSRFYMYGQMVIKHISIVLTFIWNMGFLYVSSFSSYCVNCNNFHWNVRFWPFSDMISLKVSFIVEPNSSSLWLLVSYRHMVWKLSRNSYALCPIY